MTTELTKGVIMSIPEGYVLALIVVAIFMVFSIIKIKESRADLKSPGKIRNSVNRLGVISGTVILFWAIVSMIIILVAILIFTIKN